MKNMLYGIQNNFEIKSLQEAKGVNHSSEMKRCFEFESWDHFSMRHFHLMLE
jgi:hypothetical protein